MYFGNFLSRDKKFFALKLIPPRPNLCPGYDGRSALFMQQHIGFGWSL
jgi:hypothetical protein